MGHPGPNHSNVIRAHERPAGFYNRAVLIHVRIQASRVATSESGFGLLLVFQVKSEQGSNSKKEEEDCEGLNKQIWIFLLARIRPSQVVLII